MSETELKEVYNLYTDCWKLYHEYYTAETDEEWENLLRKANELVKKYGDYSRSLILDTICLIEKGVKNGKEQRRKTL